GVPASPGSGCRQGGEAGEARPRRAGVPGKTGGVGPAGGEWAACHQPGKVRSPIALVKSGASPPRRRISREAAGPRRPRKGRVMHTRRRNLVRAGFFLPCLLTLGCQSVGPRG